MEERQDLISRQAAIDEWRNDFKGYVNALNIPRDDYNGIMAYIDELPSVTPKRKTGEWIEYDSDEDKYDVIKCPCCKHTFTVDSYHWTDIGFVKDDFKFCPNCGAMMT